MSQSAPDPDLFRSDDLLPPVEPPSAGFLVQLFIVPAVIVLVIVGIWLLITWIARQGDNPRQYIPALSGSGPNRWQMAVNLADALRDPQNLDFKRDSQAASQIADLLKKEVAEGNLQESPVTLRIYLCRALGEFQVPDGLDALLEAAKTERDPAEVHVRIAALNAIALLAENVMLNNPPRTLSHPKLESTLLALADDSNDVVRSSAAFAMGVVGSPTLMSRLTQMLGDRYPDARYNAALGLARQGQGTAVPVLVEMLDPETRVGVEIEKEKGLRETKQASIFINALRGARLLAEKEDASVDWAPLVEAIRALSTAPLGKYLSKDSEQFIHKAARETLGKLPAAARQPSASPAG